MDELNGNEKYYYMTSSLPTNSKRVGNIETGDIMLYGSDCLVIFYESFNTPYSYTRIGKIDNPSSLKGTVGKDGFMSSFRTLFFTHFIFPYLNLFQFLYL